MYVAWAPLAPHFFPPFPSSRTREKPPPCLRASSTSPSVCACVAFCSPFFRFFLARFSHPALCPILMSASSGCRGAMFSCYPAHGDCRRTSPLRSDARPTTFLLASTFFGRDGVACRRFSPDQRKAAHFLTPIRSLTLPNASPTPNLQFKHSYLRPCGRRQVHHHRPSDFRARRYVLCEDLAAFGVNLCMCVRWAADSAPSCCVHCF